VHDKAKSDQDKEKTSILEEVDFELSLIHRDEINVAYILNLLMTLSKMAPKTGRNVKKKLLI
jgi:type I restriction enzyme, R subunit